MSELRSIYYEDVRPVLMKNKANIEFRSAAFEVIKRRQNGAELSAKQDRVDRILLEWGLDSFQFVPLSKRRNWVEQPD